MSRIRVIELGNCSLNEMTVGLLRELKAADRVYVESEQDTFGNELQQEGIVSSFITINNLIEVAKNNPMDAIVYVSRGNCAETDLMKVVKERHIKEIELDFIPSQGYYPADPLVAVMAQLRSSEGCPWDREQTHLSLKKYLIEEAYEVIEAIDEENVYKLCEELGDLLLQVVFHAQIASEHGQFNFNNVVLKITEKLKRRHPHVFGELEVASSREVINNWEKIKAEELREKGQNRISILDGIPPELPALAYAEKLQGKAAKVGFDWPKVEPVWEKVQEELSELKEAVQQQNQAQVSAELGDVLFSLVNLGRFLKVDAEDAVRQTNRKFYQRFTYMEEQARQKGISLKDLNLQKMDEFWGVAKNFFEKSGKL